MKTLKLISLQKVSGHKKGLVISLTDRAIQISHSKNRPKYLTIIKNILSANDYLYSFFEPIIKKLLIKIIITDK